MKPQNVEQVMERCPQHENCTLLTTTFKNEHGQQRRIDHLAGNHPERLLNPSYPTAFHKDKGKKVRRPRLPRF